MKVIPATEKTKDGINTYDIIIGTGLIFDYKNKKVFYCSDDKDQWSNNSLILDIEGTTVIFYVIETLSYDVVKDMAEVIRIQEMENDLDYMKSHEEHGRNCSGCDAEHGYVNIEPCRSCKDHCNYSHKEKNVC
jgi:hypothetical protein